LLWLALACFGLLWFASDSSKECFSHTHTHTS
jgi:hypothetical protein